MKLVDAFNKEGKEEGGVKTDSYCSQLGKQERLEEKKLFSYLGKRS